MSREATRKLQKLFPFVEMAGKHNDVPRLYAPTWFGLHFNEGDDFIRIVFSLPASCIVVVVVVALLFYVHGKHLRSCRDGQLT